MKLAVAFLLCALSAFSQDAQLSGVIQDPSALKVPDAEISVRNEQTGGKRLTQSDASGNYSVPSLNPGVYRIAIHATGFETVIREGVKLEVGDDVRIDFKLRIGDSRTIVIVKGGPPLMNTENASVGTVIDRKFIDELPLNGRGIQTLVELTPGVVVVPVTSTTAGQFAVNGQRSDANYFTVDGVSANFAVGVTSTVGFFLPMLGQAGGGSLPANNLLGNFNNLFTPDSLQEFQIQTSTFAPEFGRSPGAQVGLATRSGANRYSGGLFEYLRNDKTDASDWFSNQQGLPKPPLRFNNFGGTLGGPIQIPRLYNGHDRSFFFFSLDDLVMRQPQTPQYLVVPSNEVRSAALPLLAPLLSAFPLPNVAPSSIGLTDPNLAAYVGSYSVQNNQRTYGLRLDHYFSDKLTGFARYNQSPSQVIGAFLDEPGLERYQINTQALTFGLTQMLSPKRVNEMRLNGSTQSEKFSFLLGGIGSAKSPPDSLLFPPGYSAANSNVEVALNSDCTPFFLLGTEWQSRSRQVQAVDNFSYNSGTHQFKFGADYRWLSPVANLPKLASIYYFDDAGLDSGIASRLIVARSQGTNAYVIRAFSAYAQDTWRASRSLAITYGLRWELDPAPHVSSGQIGAVQQLSSLTDLSNLTPTLPGRPFYRTRYLNLAPRVGLAWEIFDGQTRQTVLRAGAGSYYDLGQSGFENDLNVFPTTLATYLNVPFGSFPTGSSVPAFTYSPSVAAGPGYTLPRVYQWNMTLEQSFGQQTVSAAYVGSLGRHLVGSSLLDLIFLPVPGNASSIPELTILASEFSSSYNAMQLQFNRRMSQRVQAMVSYTWSHSIDNLSDDLNSSSELSGISYDVLLHPNLNRGSSDFDIRHSMNGAVLVDLPSPRNGIGALLLNNWTADSIFFARSAPPIDLATIGLNGDIRPNSVAGEPMFLYGAGYPGGKTLNPAAFSAPAPSAVEGSLGRNVLRGFGAWQIDFALHREIKLSERIALQFRAEAFNVLNHPNFANPSFPNDPQTELFPGFLPSQATLATGLGETGAQGQLNPLFQIGGPRSMQFALRLRF